MTAVVLAARGLPESDFGVFAYAQAAALVVVGAHRAAVLQPVLLDPTLDPHRPIREVRARMFLVAAAVLALSLAMALKGGTVGEIALVVAIIAPPMLYHDAVRAHYQGRHKHRVLLLGDVVNLIVTVAWVATAAELNGGLRIMSIGFAMGPLASALVLLPPWSQRWVSAVGPWPRRRAAGLASDYALAAGLQQMLVLVAAAFLSVSAVGAIRLAQTVIGFAGAACTALEVTLTPRLRDRPRRIRANLCRAATPFIFIAVVTVVVGIVLTLMPPSFGEQLLGPTWPLAVGIVAAVAVKQALVAVTLVPVIALRVADRAALLATARLLTAASTVGVALAVLAASDLVSFVWALVAMQLATALTFWFVAFRARDHDSLSGQCGTAALDLQTSDRRKG